MSVSVFDKRSISLPPDVAQAVDKRVGRGGFSAYASSAIARQLRRDSLDDIIAGIEGQHGPVSEAAVDAIAARFGQ